MSGRFTRVWILDFEGKRYRRDTSLTQADGTFDTTDYFADGKWLTLFPGTRSSWTRESSEAGFTDGIARYNPALLIARALDNISTATWIGESRASGANSDVVEFSWNAGSRLRLHIDRIDKRVRRVEGTTGDPLRGDDVVMHDFEGDLVVAGVSFPQRIVLRRREQVFTTSRTVTLEVNPPFDNALFTIPSELTEFPRPHPARPIGDGLYEMAATENGEWYVQFLDLGNGVAVFDASVSQAVAREVTDQIKIVLGDKPIKYVILSHAHDDHVAGVGHYAQLGATIITTRENAALVTRYANVSSRLADTSPAPRQALDFIFVDGASLRIRGTAGRSVTVYRLDDLPHVKPMLVAYYPPAKTLLNADLYSETTPFDDGSARLAAWTKKKSAPSIDWIAGTHHRKVSYSDLQVKAVAFEKSRESESLL